jgi:hypothetical protein
MPGKTVVIKLLGDARDEYLQLQTIVREEQEKGVKSSFRSTLLASIESKFTILKSRYDYGAQVPKRMIPLKYRQLYEVTNLWVVDLSNYWRMTYTLKQPLQEGGEVEILSIWLDVLDIIDHPAYDKIFGYKKK